MKRLLIVLTIVGVLLVACSPVHSSPSEVVKVGVGDQFTLVLVADAATGYEWFASYDTTRLDLVKTWFDRRGMQYLKFRASRVGNSRIELVYVKTEVGARPDDKRMEFQVDAR